MNIKKFAAGSINRSSRSENSYKLCSLGQECSEKKDLIGVGIFYLIFLPPFSGANEHDGRVA